MKGGFGQDISNQLNIVEGDGHWFFQYGEIDTSGWGITTYNFTIDGGTAAVYRATIDYNQDQQGGFRAAVTDDQIGDTTFSFSLVPEPTTVSLIVLGALGMLARRRR